MEIAALAIASLRWRPEGEEMENADADGYGEAVCLGSALCASADADGVFGDCAVVPRGEPRIGYSWKEGRIVAKSMLAVFRSIPPPRESGFIPKYKEK